jgi:hypothetical protein
MTTNGTATKEVKIDKGLPIPDRTKETASKYPWRAMEVGDSFLVAQEPGEAIHMARDRANKITQYAKRTGRTFCTRKVEGGVRVWRLT